MSTACSGAEGQGRITFEDCDFGFTGDDCIHISTSSFPVARVESPTSLIVATNLYWDFILPSFQGILKPGSTVTPLAYGTFAPGEDLALAGFEVLDPGSIPVPPFFQEHSRLFHMFTPHNSYCCFLVAIRMRWKLDPFQIRFSTSGSA